MLTRTDTERELRIQVKRLQGRLTELESTGRAINRGEVDAIVVNGTEGSEVFTMQGPNDPYRIFVERMNEGAATLTANGTVIYCNRRLAEMVALRPESLIGSSFDSILCDGRRHELQGLFERARRVDVRAESELLRRDGVPLAVQLSVSRFAYKKEGDPTFTLVASDLTELKKAQLELKEQAEVFEKANDAIIVRDIDGRIRSWNKGATKLYGWSAEEAIGRICFGLLKVKLDRPIEAIMESLYLCMEWEGEKRQVHRNGNEITVASRWTLLRDERGNPSTVIEVNRDITRAKLAELELQRSEQAYRTLADFVPQLVWRASPEGENVYFNQQWVNYTGQSVEESRGAGWEVPFHPDDRQLVWDAWNHSVRTGNTFRISFRLRAVNGSYRWFLSKGLPLRDGDGNILEWLGTCTDIDEFKRTEENKMAQNAELERRVALRTAEAISVNHQLTASVKDLESFAYSVSHDLRAPVRHLDGFLTLLHKKNYSRLDDTSKHYIDCALQASQRMGRLIDELLRFSRLGRGKIRGIPVDLNALIDHARQELEPEIAGRNVVWRIDQLPSVIAEEALLRQVISNLLENSLKFTRYCETPEISVGSKRDRSDEVVIFVRDNGAGFDMRYYDKLFQVFQRLHGEDEFDGTGIGLAIVRRVIERHGGRVWAEGIIGTGATFYFSLPLSGIEERGLNERIEADRVS